MNKFISVLFVFALLIPMFCMTVSAESYSDDYPDIYNSGSPLWIHCNIRDYGDYVILLDPSTNPQTFGFDAPTGYNLINNSATTVNGRAYATGSTAGYTVRWLTYYCLQFRVSSGGQYTWQDVYITDIYGTTMDFVDYVGDRGNDAYKYDLKQRDFYIFIAVVVLIIVVLLVISMVFKPRLFRM